MLPYFSTGHLLMSSTNFLGLAVIALLCICAGRLGQEPYSTHLSTYCLSHQEVWHVTSGPLFIDNIPLHVSGRKVYRDGSVQARHVIQRLHM